MVESHHNMFHVIPAPNCVRVARQIATSSQRGEAVSSRRGDDSNVSKIDVRLVFDLTESL